LYQIYFKTMQWVENGNLLSSGHVMGCSKSGILLEIWDTAGFLKFGTRLVFLKFGTRPHSFQMLLLILLIGQPSPPASSDIVAQPHSFG